MLARKTNARSTASESIFHRRQQWTNKRQPRSAGRQRPRWLNRSTHGRRARSIQECFVALRAQAVSERCGIKVAKVLVQQVGYNTLGQYVRSLKRLLRV